VAGEGGREIVIEPMKNPQVRERMKTILKPLRQNDFDP